MTGVVTPFRPKPAAPAEVLAYICECGGESFHMLFDGRVCCVLCGAHCYRITFQFDGKPPGALP